MKKNFNKQSFELFLWTICGCLFTILSFTVVSASHRNDADISKFIFKTVPTSFVFEGGSHKTISAPNQASHKFRSVWHTSVSRQKLAQSKINVDKVDPDANKNLTELIITQGYPCEKYTIKTEDGFLLDLHRIPHGRGSIRKDNTKPVVYLQHALLSSACDWVMNFADDSLGFILADAGYDVWMGNSRGNTYSRRHVTLKPDDEKFWNWSFDEMAKYDVPAFLDFILKTTRENSLYYVGHSQGTTMAFALLSERPDIQEKIKLFVALAPVTHITHTPSPIKYLAEMPDWLLYDVFGRKDFLVSSTFLKFLVDTFCKEVLTRWACFNIMFLFSGPDLSNLNQTRLEVYMNHSPAGVSAKDMVHFAQVYREKKFIMYDYGSPAENEKHYNQSTPPEYDVSKVTLPIVAFTATNDWLADPQDAAALLKSLPNVKAHYVIKGWNHLDFVWGEDAAKLCYTHILQWLQKF